MRSLRLVALLVLAAAGVQAGTFTVTNTNQNGPGSLYQALYDVIGSTSSMNTINFSIGSGPVKISPNFQFPYITKPVIIDGTTQPGYSGTPIVELDGTAAAAGFRGCVGLRLAGGNSTVKGLVVNNYSNHDGLQGLGAGAGIVLASSNNTVVNCYLGTDVTGMIARKNDVGIRIENGANNSVIGTSSSSVTTRNLISANDVGVESDWGSVGTTGTQIRGNWFGYNAAGAATMKNYWGFYLDKLSGGVIGGTGPGQGNIFVDLNALGASTGVQILGNRFGVNSTNTWAGLVLGHANGNIIGGTAPGAGNTFTNLQFQWALSILKSANNVVQGNTFTNVNVAISVTSQDEPGTANGNMIGGTAEGAGNTIRTTGNEYWGGVDVYGAVGTSILRNSISGTAALGINLGTGGHGYPTPVVPTPNDPGDGDSGPNNRQNFPVITTVTSGNGSTTFAGTLNSAAFGSYRIELFSNASCDPSGYGEGETYLGSTNVTTDGSGNGSFLLTFNTVLPLGRIITATATDSAGNTSEFSACASVTGAGALQFSSSSTSINEGGGSATINVSRISGAIGAVTVNYATANGSATAGADYTTTTGTLTFGDGEVSKTISVPIVQDVVYEGNEAFTVALASPGGGALLVPPTTNSVTIVDDDQPTHATIGDIRVTEGNSGTTDAIFTVTLSPAPTATSTLQWTTNPGTAAATADYAAASGTLTFNAGETQKTITVSVVGDNVYEADETFTVALSNPMNILIDRAAGVCTIANDDPQPIVSADDVTIAEGNSGTTNVAIKLKVSQPYSGTINYATVADTALAGSDFSAASASVNFSNETEKQIVIAVNGDLTPEADERFKVHLSTSDPAVVLAHPDVVVTIANDDISVSPSVLSIGTGQSGALIVDVGNPVTATQTLAISKSDACIKVPATVDIAAGQHTASIVVTAMTAPCSARVDIKLPPALGGGTLSAGVRTYQTIDLTFDPASPQLFVGQSITVVVKATPFDGPMTLTLAVASATVEVPPTVDVVASGGTFTMRALRSGSIFVEVTLPAQYGGTKIGLTGNVTEPPATVTILDVTPKSGAQTGGTPVAIDGTNFTPDCAVVFDNVPATNIAFVNTSRLTAATPAHKAGAVDVTVTCLGHPSTLKNGFVYTGGAPDITAVSPASGTTGGGTTVRITGRDLVPDCWVELGGELARNVNVASATEMIATTPAHVAGAVTVKLRCQGGAAGALPNGFTYLPQIEPSAVVTTVDPLSAAPGQQVTILGSRFRATDTVTFDDMQAQVLSTTPDAHVVVVPSMPSGKVSVTVAGSTTGPIFTVLDPEAPKVTKLTPPVLPAGAELTIDGSGFRAPYTITIGGAAARIVTMSFKRVVVRVPSMPAGRYELDIVNGDTVAAVGGNVTVSTTGVVVTGASPQCVATDGGTVISIVGSGFAAGATVTINGVAATKVKVVDAANIDARTPALPPGPATIVVTLPSGDNGSATNALRVFSPLDPDGCSLPPRARPVHR